MRFLFERVLTEKNKKTKWSRLFFVGTPTFRRPSWVRKSTGPPPPFIGLGWRGGCELPETCGVGVWIGREVFYYILFQLKLGKKNVEILCHMWHKDGVRVVHSNFSTQFGRKFRINTSQISDRFFTGKKDIAWIFVKLQPESFCC